MANVKKAFRWSAEELAEFERRGVSPADASRLWLASERQERVSAEALLERLKLFEAHYQERFRNYEQTAQRIERQNADFGERYESERELKALIEEIKAIREREVELASRLQVLKRFVDERDELERGLNKLYQEQQERDEKLSDFIARAMSQRIPQEERSLLQQLAAIIKPEPNGSQNTPETTKRV